MIFPSITQRQAALALLIVSVVGAWSLLALELIRFSSSVLTLVPGCIIFTTLLVVYLRTNWRYTLPLLVILHTLNIIAIPEPYVTQKLSLAVITPSLLALVLLDTPWILGVGFVTALGLAIRADGGGPIAGEPTNLLIYIVTVLLVAIGRLVTTTAQRAAETNAQRAEAAMAETSMHAERLAISNMALSQEIEAQHELLKLIDTLEVPMMTIADGVLFVPLVGAVDSRRATALTDQLLKNVHAQRTKYVILDVSGIGDIDTAVAKHIMQAIQAVHLLGADVILTGVSANMATTMTHLHISFGNVISMRSPQAALQHITTVAASNTRTTRGSIV